MLTSILNVPCWSYTLWGNALADYGRALLAFFVLLLVFHLIQRLILRRLQKVAARTRTEIDDVLWRIVRKVKPPFYSFLAFYFALQFLQVHPFVDKVFRAIVLIWVTYLVIHALQILVAYTFRKRMHLASEQETQTAIGAISKLITMIVWFFGLLLVLANLGFNINSLVAGLGIGGIAVAFALQNILADLFSSFAIYFDKPFIVGDYIVVGKQKGIVERIGVKTTRLRSLQGEEIVMSNRQLTSAEIHNFKKLQKRRVFFRFSVVYDTPPAMLKKIPELIQGIISAVALVNYERAHLIKFGETALVFEVAYTVQSAEYKRYLDIQEKILLGIKEKFEHEGIALAGPPRAALLPK